MSCPTCRLLYSSSCIPLRTNTEVINILRTDELIWLTLTSEQQCAIFISYHDINGMGTERTHAGGGEANGICFYLPTGVGGTRMLCRHRWRGDLGSKGGMISCEGVFVGRSCSIHRPARTS